MNIINNHQHKRIILQIFQYHIILKNVLVTYFQCGIFRSAVFLESVACNQTNRLRSLDFEDDINSLGAMSDICYDMKVYQSIICKEIKSQTAQGIKF